MDSISVIKARIVIIMVYRICAFGRSNSSSEKVSLHKFPREPALRKQWEKQVQRTRAQWNAT